MNPKGLETPPGMIVIIGQMGLGAQIWPKLWPKMVKKRNNAKSNVMYDSPAINGGI